MGVGERNVTFFSCSVSKPVTCASVGELGVGVGEGGGVGILRRSILKGINAVGKQVGWFCSACGDFFPTEGDSKVVASEDPGVGGSWLGP